MRRLMALMQRHKIKAHRFTTTLGPEAVAAVPPAKAFNVQVVPIVDPIVKLLFVVPVSDRLHTAKPLVTVEEAQTPTVNGIAVTKTVVFLILCELAATKLAAIYTLSYLTGVCLTSWLPPVAFSAAPVF